MNRATKGSAPAPASPPRRAGGDDPLPLLLLAALLVLALALLAAALRSAHDGPWLLACLLIGAGLGGYVLRELWSAREADPATARRHGGAPASEPVRAATPSAAAAIEATGAHVELRRELERLKAMERQLTQAKHEAEAATMAKGEFLATMSHEIRTPLNGIIPLLDIVLSGQLAPDQKDYVQTAYQSARQLLSIVDDILDYSKIEANKLELESVGINIKEIVDSVTRLLAKNAESKGLRFTFGIEPNVRLAMRGDPVRLRQVLTNLVSNAIKFTERGQVAIEVRKRGDSRSHSELLFSVRDTGVGISSEAQARLFKPFAQADASTTRIHGGTGLGLVICKRIVDLMGGQIGVKSEAGKGSTFWFSVPLLKAMGDMQPARSDLHGSRALIVTTDQALLRRISGWLTTWGVQFAQTSVSAEALAKLRASAGMGEAWSYDFLVLDWGAMKNSALSLARNVMREGTLEAVRILAIGGDEDLPSEVRGAPRMLALGRQVGDVELRSALQRLLDRDGSAGEAAPAAVDSLLPPPLPTEHRHATAGAMPAAIVPPAAAGVPVVAGAVGGHVLLVEDNPVNRQVAQRLLALVGVSHDVAENGKQALDCLAQSRYDAVLMDCQMPIMDGYTATRTMRRLEADGQRKGHLPIIAMTANAMAGDREKCLGAGMDDYMSKPLNRALLEQTLRKWIAPGAPTRAGATTVAPAAATPAPHPATAPAAAPTPMPGNRTPATAAIAATPIATPRIGAQVAQPAPAALDQRAPAAFGLSGNLGEPIDAGVIQDLLEVMGDEFTDLVRVYLEDAPKSVSQLERAAMAGSLDGLVAPAHSLKSTSANLGALGLSDMAKRIEHGARSGGLPGEAVMLVAELGNEYQRVAAEFRRLLGGAA